MKLFPHDTAILRTLANTFLKFSIKLPPWLVQRYSVGILKRIPLKQIPLKIFFLPQKVHFGDLLRALIDYDELADAFQLLLDRLDEARQQLKQIVVQHIRNNVAMRIVEEEAAQLLPYTHIETLLQLAERSEERSKLVSCGLEGKFGNGEVLGNYFYFKKNNFCHFVCTEIHEDFGFIFC
jgi:hypothetical protein